MKYKVKFVVKFINPDTNRVEEVSLSQLKNIKRDLEKILDAAKYGYYDIEVTS